MNKIDLETHERRYAYTQSKEGACIYKHARNPDRFNY